MTEEYAFDNANWRAAYISLTEFDNLWPEHEYAGHKLQGETNENPEFTVTTEKTRFVPCLLLYMFLFRKQKYETIILLHHKIRLFAQFVFLYLLPLLQKLKEIISKV